MTPTLRLLAFVAWLGVRTCAGVVAAAADVVAWTRLA